MFSIVAAPAYIQVVSVFRYNLLLFSLEQFLKSVIKFKIFLLHCMEVYFHFIGKEKAAGTFLLTLYLIPFFRLSIG